jgi:hypothetical protein
MACPELQKFWAGNDILLMLTTPNTGATLTSSIRAGTQVVYCIQNPWPIDHKGLRSVLRVWAFTRLLTLILDPVDVIRQHSA